MTAEDEAKFFCVARHLTMMHAIQVDIPADIHC